MALVIHTERIIDAPPSAVWAALTDLTAYSAWNPFIIEASGTAQEGEHLRLRIRLGDSTQSFRPTVTEVQPHRTLEWLGRLAIPGAFAGRHRFELQPTAEGGTYLVQSERFSGIAVRLIPGLEQKTRAGFEQMNETLSIRTAER